MDAILMFGLSLDTVRNWIVNVDPKDMPRKFDVGFVGVLRKLYLCWVNQNSIYFRKEMNEIQKLMGNRFEDIGFVKRESQCVIKSFLAMLEQVIKII
jgi:hypothetical protein